MNTERNMLATILDGGIGDIDFLIKELENWNIDFEDAWEECAEFEDRSCNSLISSIYYLAFEKAIEYFKSPEVEEDDELTDNIEDELRNGVDIFINSIDSHFYLNDANGDQEEIYDYDELIDFIAKFIADSK